MNISEFPISRQKVLLGAGLGLVTAVVAACTTYGKKPEAAGESSTTTAAAPATGGPAPAANAIAKTADVPVGSGVIVGEVVVTQPGRDDRLPVPWQQVQPRRFGGQRPGADSSGSAGRDGSRGFDRSRLTRGALIGSYDNGIVAPR